MTRLRELAGLGQSPWVDSLSRNLVTSGELGRLVTQGIVGVTDNPTIFQQALATGGGDYDAAIRAGVAEGLDAAGLYERLITEDVAAALDILAPVHAATGGADGFVSLEVAPSLARDTAGTVAAAQAYWAQLRRPNLLIKIPATAEGIPAIEQAIAAGINVNVTLIFALDRYRAVMEAYCRGLERRLARGEDVGAIRSVASFFVSRIDTEVDRRLEALASRDPGRAPAALGLRGEAAIASARIAYEAFLEVMRGPRFAALAAAGAQVQRPLWASTSTKSPAYRDVRYVEALIGPDTVDTMPLETVAAFIDHGAVAVTVTENPQGAHTVVEALDALGIPMDEVTEVLEQEGVEKFSRSMDELLAALADRRAALREGGPARGSPAPSERLAGLVPAPLPAGAAAPAFQSAVVAAAGELRERRAAERLARSDAGLFSADPAVRRAIAERLGWLDEPARQLAALEPLAALRRFAGSGGFRHAVLVGMGGSSLCPFVLRETFGPQPGFPDLVVVDSTDPDQVQAVAAAIDGSRTCLVVSSKSGTTTETLAHLAFFHRLLVDAVGEAAGDRCLAVTDPGSPLEDRARSLGFHAVVSATPTIGGRYSALSAFGMVPAAVMGLDVERLLRAGATRAAAVGAPSPGAEAAGVDLAAWLAGCARVGRDKVTLVADAGLAAFPAWIEQLLAESTGKAGRGLVPVADEPLGAPKTFGPDRCFVHLRLGSTPEDPQRRERFGELAALGHPVATLTCPTPADLGAEFVRWEVATALAGLLLGIDPFDQPNVQESKDNTARLLAEVATGRPLPEPPPEVVADGLSLTGGVAGDDLATAVRRWREGVAPPWYVAVMAYVPMTAPVAAALADLRAALGAATGAAVTVGYGPRFLHSTGQLHKGGPETVAFLQITTDHRHAPTIPDRPYDFATLQAAQALGDLLALRQRGRRLIRVHVADPAEGIRRLAEVLAAAAAAARP